MICGVNITTHYKKEKGIEISNPINNHHNQVTVHHIRSKN